jgi:hypothetical protein
VPKRTSRAARSILDISVTARPIAPARSALGLTTFLASSAQVLTEAANEGLIALQGGQASRARLPGL